MNAYVQSIPTCGLGEGPHWNATKQELLYVDISGQSVHRYVPATGEHTQVRINEERATLVVPVEGQPNKYVVGIGRTLQMMEWDGRSSEPTSLTSMYTVEPNYPQNRFNDGKCDSEERLWAGTMNDASQPISNLYKITNTIQTMQTGVGISNGLAWNRNNTLMFYNDTPTNKVDVFDFNNANGTISNRRTVYDYSREGERGSPDGLTIDANDNLWVACWGGSQIIQVNSTTGLKMRSIDMPAKNITSIAFGGPNLDVMYVTSARDGLSEEEQRQQPSAGSVFQITNVGVRGLAGNNFKP